MTEKQMDIEYVNKLADEHWAFIFDTLKVHEVNSEQIEIAKLHYKSAFIHGYKHAWEDLVGD